MERRTVVGRLAALGLGQPRLRRAAAAGMGYFGVVFAVGFVLGAARVMMVAPRLGERWAVAAEVPVMLGLSWMACGWMVRRYGVGRARAARLVMGGVAFGLLMGAEMGISVWGFGRSIAAQLEQYGSVAGGLGLAAQVAFGLFPLARRGG